MKITVKIKNVYGVETIYPACAQSELLAKLSNTKTLTKANIEIIKQLGYEIQVESKTL